jgi:hypothetical protein
MMTIIVLVYYGVKKLVKKLTAKSSPACGEVLA